VRTHLKACVPCGEHFDAEQAFLKFVEARGRSGCCASDELKRRILRELFDE